MAPAAGYDVLIEFELDLVKDKVDFSSSLALLTFHVNYTLKTEVVLI